MIDLKSIKHFSKEEGYSKDQEKLLDCDWRMLKDSYENSKRFCTLAQDPRTLPDTRSTGLLYIAKQDVGLELDLIKFENEFLPEGKSFSRKVVFLDRDGILIKDSGYPGKIEDVVFEQEVLPLLKSLKDRNFEFIVITNQSGIARGFYSEEDFKMTSKYIEDYYHKNGITILKTYHSPFHENGNVHPFNRKSILRKPAPGMILQAAKEYEVDIMTSIMIGDRLTDKINLEGLRSFVVGQTTKTSEFKTFQDLRDHLESIL